MLDRGYDWIHGNGEEETTKRKEVLTVWLLRIEGYEWRDVYSVFSDKKSLHYAYQ